MIMKAALAVYLALTLLLPGCAASGIKEETAAEVVSGLGEEAPARSEEAPSQSNEVPAQGNEAPAQNAEAQSEEHTKEDEEMELKLTIADTPVSVEWQDNESVKALKELAEEGPLTVEMEMYGGFEQVGSLGSRLPSSDSQTTTSCGDIVLYSSDRIVIFYGSNSWSYTRLGRITDKSGEELRSLLSNGDVSITIAVE